MGSVLSTSERRTAATWVAATGAFLLVAAAAVFVSVRWDDIPDAAKLGVLLAGTGAALVGGRSLARTLPATGGVLFHLGAFLLPVDLAAASLRTDMTWGELLVGQGVLVGLGLGGLALWSDSIVLRWASIAGVVGLAGGIGAVSGVPAPVALVGFAVVAAAVREPRVDAASTWWAALAGLAPALAGPGRTLVDGGAWAVGAGTLTDVGFDQRSLAFTAWGVGLVAAGLLAIAAQRRADVAIAFVAIAVAVLGVVTSLAAGEVGGTVGVLSIAGGFLAIELVALALRRDPFWSEPLHVIGVLAEIVAVPAVLIGWLLGWLGSAFSGEYDLAMGAALGVAAVGWLAADLRRQPESNAGLVLRLARGGGNVVLNVFFAATATASVWIFTMHPARIALAVATIAALLVFAGRPGSSFVTVAAVVTGSLIDHQHLWLVLPAVGVCTWTAALRRDQLLAAVAAVGLDAFAFRLLADMDVGRPFAGLAVCVTAIVWAGLAAVAEDEWRDLLIVPAIVAVVAGLPFAAEDPRALADAIVVTGGLLAAGGLVARVTALAHLGGVLVTLGMIGHLAAAGVDVAEPYVLPVALHLLVAGWQRRQQTSTSSWLAYTPGVVLVGGTALAERVTGGAEWHVLVAAAVGTTAVAIGGWQRLAGPLLVGTGLLVATTAHESLGALAGIPTWTWLAVAGTTLLGTGIALERTDTSPVTAGRRLVDVIGERFE